MSEQTALIIEKIKDISPDFSEILEVSINHVPYIGKIYQSIKVARLEKRFKENKKKIDEIGKLLSSTKLNAEFINERIFPIVFYDLLEEHEDAKIQFILSGFKNILIEEKNDESIIINYFDTLRNLRYEDIKRLLYFANVIETYPNYSDESGKRALVLSIDRKLENMGLALFQKSWGQIEGNEHVTNKENVKLSLYGQKFLEFIKKD